MDEQPLGQPEHLTSFLADRDEPCPLCDYNLRGLTGDHCPECGKQLTLRIGLEDPVMGAYVVGIVGLACLLGFAALTLLWFIALTIIEGPGLPAQVWVIIFVEAVIATVFLAAWVQSRSKIRRSSPATRSTLAFLCCAAPIVGVILFTMVLVSTF